MAPLTPCQETAATLPKFCFCLFVLMLIFSDVQSLTQQSELEAVVKTLAPALLAELVKMNPVSSPSRAKKDSGSEASQQKSKVDAYFTTGFVINTF